MKKSFVRGTWQVKRAFSPAVIAEGAGRTIFIAGHTGQTDDAGKSLSAIRFHRGIPQCRSSHFRIQAIKDYDLSSIHQCGRFCSREINHGSSECR